MSEAKKSKKSTSLIALIVVLIVAVILIVVQTSRSNSLQAEVDTKNIELTESRAAEQQAKADLAVAEENLAVTEEALKEMTLSFEESQAKVDELTVQVADLTEDLTDATNRIDTSAAMLQDVLATLTGVPVVEEAVVEEPVVEDPAVEEPAAEEPEYAVTVNEDGSTTIKTATAEVTFTVDENGAIATIKAVVDGNEVAEDALAQFIGKTLPLDEAAITPDETGVPQAIVDALAFLSQPVEAAA